MSLEELSNINITSVSKRPKKLSDAASAVFVLTHQDISRAAVRSIPEALRLIPNLQVARIAANQYAISARGFNSSTSNKLLVMIDGRNIYTPLYSGVFWDVQDIVLQDIERIEVISGPGASLWGANAVNGVINIITFNAQKTTGNLVSAMVGEDSRSAVVRAGYTLSDTSSYRIYAKTINATASINSHDEKLRDALHSTQIGFRYDDIGGAYGLTVHGDSYIANSQQASDGDREMAGSNLLGRWVHNYGDGDSVQFQAYFDHTYRKHPAIFAETLDTFDLDFIHSSRIGANHDFLWGLGFRYANDQVENATVLAFLPAHRVLVNSNFSFQDQFQLIPDKLGIDYGVKFERNPYSGIDIQPSTHFSWKVSDQNMLWFGLSRAARAPSRVDHDLYAPSTPPFYFAGGPRFRSETAIVTELGYRGELWNKTFVAINLYHNEYRHLRNIARQSDGVIVLRNQLRGESNGLEMWGETQITPDWRLKLAYSALRKNLLLCNGEHSPSDDASSGNDPPYQLFLRSNHNLTSNTRFDVDLRRVGELPSPKIAAYTALDLRFAWQISRNTELALIGRNLLKRSHVEFFLPSASNRYPSEVGRNFRLVMTWKN